MAALYTVSFTIRDTFGMWIQNNSCWEDSKLALNQFGNLKWNTKNLTHTITFLNLQLLIRYDKLHTATFQKQINLCAYIPSFLVCPSSCFKGFITGELLCAGTKI